jgi:hypothetical protein
VVEKENVMQVIRSVVFDVTTKSRKKAERMIKDYIAICRMDKFYQEGSLLTVIEVKEKR